MDNTKKHIEIIVEVYRYVKRYKLKIKKQKHIKILSRGYVSCVLKGKKNREAG